MCGAKCTDLSMLIFEVCFLLRMDVKNCTSFTVHVYTNVPTTVKALILPPFSLTSIHTQHTCNVCNNVPLYTEGTVFYKYMC